MQRMLASVLAFGAMCLFSACGGGGSGSRSPGEQPDQTQYRYFSGSALGNGQEDWELWRTDGTADGTRLVHDIAENGSAYPDEMTVVGNRVFFVASNDDRENIWVTDGSDDGLQALLQVDVMGYASQLTALGDVLYFVLSTEAHGPELWRSDGTPAGTVQVVDLAPGACGSHPSSLTAFRGELYFAAVNSCIGRPGLWKTDGTAAGTVAVLTPSSGSYPSNLTPWGDMLYFSAQVDTEYGLWRTDGTAAGTTRVRGIRVAQHANMGLFTVAGDLLFFRANEGEHEAELWKSDGTEEGTSMVLDIHPDGAGNPQWLVALGDEVYFAAYAGESYTRLWRSDGTAAGTVQVHDADGNAVRNMRAPVVYRDSLYFAALRDGDYPLWRLHEDGNTAEVLRDDLHLYSHRFYRPFVLNDRLLFVADDGQHGQEWWRSEGAPDNTVLVRDICPGACASMPVMVD